MGIYCAGRRGSARLDEVFNNEEILTSSGWNNRVRLRCLRISHPTLQTLC